MAEINQLLASDLASEVVISSRQSTTSYSTDSKPRKPKKKKLDLKPVGIFQKYDPDHAEEKYEPAFV